MAKSAHYEVRGSSQKRSLGHFLRLASVSKQSGGCNAVEQQLDFLSVRLWNAVEPVDECSLNLQAAQIVNSLAILLVNPLGNGSPPCPVRLGRCTADTLLAAADTLLAAAADTLLADTLLAHCLTP